MAGSSRIVLISSVLKIRKIQVSVELQHCQISHFLMASL